MQREKRNRHQRSWSILEAQRLSICVRGGPDQRLVLQARQVVLCVRIGDLKAAQELAVEAQQERIQAHLDAPDTRLVGLRTC